MLRALTDLVCISTACPCDIDAANGWNPTDIQVRTYKKTEDFKRSIGWRKTRGLIWKKRKKQAFTIALHDILVILSNTLDTGSRMK